MQVQVQVQLQQWPLSTWEQLVLLLSNLELLIGLGRMQHAMGSPLSRWVGSQEAMALMVEPGRLLINLQDLSTACSNKSHSARQPAARAGAAPGGLCSRGAVSLEPG